MLLKDINKLASKLNNLPKVSRGLDELFQDHVANILMRLFYHHGIKGVGWYLDMMNYDQLDRIEIRTIDRTYKDTYRPYGGWGEQVTDVTRYRTVNICCIVESWGFLLKKSTNIDTGEIEVCWRSVA